MLEKLTNLEKLDDESKSKVIGGQNCLRVCVGDCQNTSDWWGLLISSNAEAGNTFSQLPSVQ